MYVEVGECECVCENVCVCTCCVCVRVNISVHVHMHAFIFKVSWCGRMLLENGRYSRRIGRLIETTGEH